MTTKAKKPVSKPAPKKPLAKPSKAVATTEPVATQKRAHQNGISQPAEGTSCRAVWDAIDKLLAQDKRITLEAVREIAGDKMADATIRTQRQRHRTYNGLA